MSHLPPEHSEYCIDAMQWYIEKFPNASASATAVKSALKDGKQLTESELEYLILFTQWRIEANQQNNAAVHLRTILSNLDALMKDGLGSRASDSIIIKSSYYD